MDIIGRVNIKPLSVNQAYQGRRFARPELTAYKNSIVASLRREVCPTGALQVSYTFGVSSKNADLDNCVKAFQDALSARYDFNDKQICRMIAEKVIVPKGQEYVAFDIRTLLDKKP